MNKVTIIEFNDNDVTEIISLILNIQQNEFHLPITKADQPDLENVKTFYQSGQGNFWVAKHGDQIVGTLALLDIGNRDLALRKMFVKKEFRGSPFHTAQQLLAVALSWGKNHHIAHIYLGTTEKFLAAHRFYDKNNFIKIEKSALPKTFPIMPVDSVFYNYKF